MSLQNNNFSFVVDERLTEQYNLCVAPLLLIISSIAFAYDIKCNLIKLEQWLNMCRQTQETTLNFG